MEVTNLPIVVHSDEAINAARSIFSDTDIRWDVINANSGQMLKDVVGMSPASGNKVVVKISSQSVTAYYQDRHGEVLERSRPMGSVGTACADLKRLIKGENDPFTN